MNDSISPEEKLLKLIKKSNGQSISNDPPEHDSKSENDANQKQENITNNISEKPENENNSNETMDKAIHFKTPATTNNTLHHLLTLEVALYAITIFFGVLLITQIIFLNKPFTFKTAHNALDLASRGTQLFDPLEQKELNNLMDLISNKKFFKTVKKPKKIFSKKRDRIPTISELARGLSLAGIIDGDPPQAIIENQKNRQLSYLNEGQEINQLTVKQIKANSIILTFNEEELELSI